MLSLCRFEERLVMNLNLIFVFPLLQELRFEDYSAGRKGPSNPMAAPTGGLFGTPAAAAPSAATGLFGAAAANTNFSFGQNKSTFGATRKRGNRDGVIRIFTNTCRNMYQITHIIKIHSHTDCCKPLLIILRVNG